MDKFKIFISQPMLGKSEEEIINVREKYKKIIEDAGYEVINSYFKEDPPECKNPSIYYLYKSIEALSEADGVVFLPGWEKARGCRVEHDIARDYHLFILEI